jgi:hypothetical protein
MCLCVCVCVCVCVCARARVCALRWHIVFCWCFGQVSFSSLPHPGRLWSPPILSYFYLLLFFLCYRIFLKLKHTSVGSVLRRSADTFGSVLTRSADNFGSVLKRSADTFGSSV